MLYVQIEVLWAWRHFRCPDDMFPGHANAGLTSMKHHQMLLLKGWTYSRPWRGQISSPCLTVLLPNRLGIAELVLCCQTASFDWDKLGSPLVKSVPRTRHLHLDPVTLTGAEKLYFFFCCGSGGPGLHLSFLNSIDFINFCTYCGTVGQKFAFYFFLFSF